MNLTTLMVPFLATITEMVEPEQVDPVPTPTDIASTFKFAMYEYCLRCINNTDVIDAQEFQVLPQQQRLNLYTNHRLSELINSHIANHSITALISESETRPSLPPPSDPAISNNVVDQALLAYDTVVLTDPHGDKGQNDLGTAPTTTPDSPLTSALSASTPSDHLAANVITLTTLNPPQSVIFSNIPPEHEAGIVFHLAPDLPQIDAVPFPDGLPDSLYSLSAITILLASFETLTARVSLVLARDGVKQKDLAMIIGVSSSTLSPLLRAKYKHTNRSHIIKLKEWLFEREKLFIINIVSICCICGLNQDQLAVQLGISPDTLASWFTMSLLIDKREEIDNKISNYMIELVEKATGSQVAELNLSLNVPTFDVNDAHNHSYNHHHTAVLASSNALGEDLSADARPRTRARRGQDGSEVDSDKADRLAAYLARPQQQLPRHQQLDPSVDPHATLGLLSESFQIGGYYSNIPVTSAGAEQQQREKLQNHKAQIQVHRLLKPGQLQKPLPAPRSFFHHPWQHPAFVVPNMMTSLHSTFGDVFRNPANRDESNESNNDGESSVVVDSRGKSPISTYFLSSPHDTTFSSRTTSPTPGTPSEEMNQILGFTRHLENISQQGSSGGKETSSGKENSSEHFILPTVENVSDPQLSAEMTLQHLAMVQNQLQQYHAEQEHAKATGRPLPVGTNNGDDADQDYDEDLRRSLKRQRANQMKAIFGHNELISIDNDPIDYRVALDFDPVACTNSSNSSPRGSISEGEIYPLTFDE